MLLTANNPTTELAERSILTDPVSAGDLTLNVKNTQGFSGNTYIIIGEPGTEKSEIKLMSAIPSNLQMTIAASGYSHNEGDPVIYARYNQVNFYMATSENGTYTLQDTLAIDVENANGITVWDDIDGVASNFYKISYYNDVTTLESSLSDPIPGGGILINTARYVADTILRELQDTDEALTSRDEIYDWMTDCQNDVATRRRKWSFLMNRAASSKHAGREYYSIENDFGVANCDLIDHLIYNFNDGVSDMEQRLRWIPMEEYEYQSQDNDAGTSDTLMYWTWDEATDYIRFYPKPETDQTTAFYLHYFKKFDDVDSDGHTLEIPDTNIYKQYCLMRAYMKKQDQQRSLFHQAQYERLVASMGRKERKQIGQPFGFTYSSKGLGRYYPY